MKRVKTPWIPNSSGAEMASSQSDSSIQGPESTATEKPSKIPGMLDGPVERRELFKVAGAMAAMLGATSCGLVRRPEEKILPYGKAPEDVVPGLPLFYATTVAVGEDVRGLLVESHEGRPTKIEGNPQHPASLGSTSARDQAWVLDLYDPDRLRHALVDGREVDSAKAGATLDALRAKLSETRGKGVAILTGVIASPSVLRALDQVRAAFPEISLHRYEPLTLDAVYAGIESVSGKQALPIPDFTLADVIVAADSDFLGTEVGSVAATRAFAARRDPEHPRGMNRLWAMEGAFTVTGSMADHRARVSRLQVPSALAAILLAYAKKTGAALASDAAQKLAALAKMSPLPANYLEALVDDLTRSKGRAVVTAGPRQGASTHALVALLNQVLGAPGASLRYAPRPYAGHPLHAATSFESISRLAAKLGEGKIDTLVVLGGDPVYTAPRDLDLPSLLKKVPNLITLSDRRDHTASLAKTVLPRSHGLESWGDAVTVDGRVSLIQPLITPLGRSWSELEVLCRLCGELAKPADFVRQTHGALAGEKAFRSALQNGVIPGEAVQAEVRVDSAKLAALLPEPHAGELELSLDADASLHDGRFANHAWLQETPNPISKHTWGNALWVSGKTASALSLGEGDVVAVSSKDAVSPIEMPVWIAPGQADGQVSLALGHGQKTIGRLGEGVGVDAYPLLSAKGAFALASVALRPTGKKTVFAAAHGHGSMEGRDLIHTVDAAHAQTSVEAGEEHGGTHVELVEPVKYDAPNQWGMVIDLSKCTGCNACLVGCQSENNIPAVGRAGVLRGREMHWIRLDRYFSGEADGARMAKQPVACVQCEDAPCEQVCPVNATSHSREGLSDIAYNRCIGMRYCANNCPYKARRFNFLDWHQESPQSKSKPHRHLFDLMRESDPAVRLQFNPDVTVRMRGVMEKCTYCVQRLNGARAAAPKDGKPVPESAVKTACQQACPAAAIDFGNLADANSRVSRLKKLPRQYALLGELGVKPRTTYLAAVRNPHPMLPGKA